MSIEVNFRFCIASALILCSNAAMCFSKADTHSSGLSESGKVYFEYLDALDRSSTHLNKKNVEETKIKNILHL